MIAIKRLHQAFLYWQYMCRLNGAAMKVERRHVEKAKWMYPEAEIAGPLLHAGEFLTYLSQLRIGDRFAQDRFLGTAEAMELTGGGYALLPLFLAMWSVGSRRVFRVPLSGLLSASTTEVLDPDVPWNETLPHPVFVVELDEPVHGAVSYDTILVMQLETGDIICTLCDPNLQHVETLTERDILALERAVNGDPRRFASEFRTLLDRFNQSKISGLYIPLGRTDQHDPVIVQLETQVTEILRTLCIHLAYGGTTVRGEVSARMAQPFRAGPQRVFLPTDIFAVQAQHVFEKRVQIRRETSQHTGRVMSPHARRGFYRRPAGTPHDHPQTIWVGPTTINKHLLIGGQAQLRSSRLVVPTDPDKK